MKRAVIVFAVLVLGLSVGLWLKVRENQAALLRPSGGNGVIEGVEVDVSARLSARILAVRVEEGATVKKGEVLVELDCRDNRSLLAAAEGRLKAARSTAEAARAQVGAALGSARAAAAGIRASGAQSEALRATAQASARQRGRIQRLQGEGGATASDLDAVSTQVTQLGEQLQALQAQKSAARGQAAAAQSTAEAARRQAEAALATVSAAAAEVERARTLVEECLLRAPIDGVVQTRALEPGEVVLPGGRVLTLVALDEARVTFYLPNRELAAASPGRPVTVVADTYPDRRFDGRIVAVSAQAEFTSRGTQTREDRDRLVYAVQVRLKNADHALRPGMPVEVSIDGTARRP
ncbi:MAG: efflux RND transporter periplasmic adaptor subunit [Deltaproteobacteria bacterium]|nr:efflux RND transporter periplasmic adaptor subunit [Deltaproteobacteria bacterium]